MFRLFGQKCGNTTLHHRPNAIIGCARIEGTWAFQISKNLKFISKFKVLKFIIIGVRVQVDTSASE